MERRDIGVVFLGILTLVAMGFVLKVAKGVVVPLVIAWLLSYILGPVVNAMARRRIPTPVAVFAVMLLLIGVCVLAGFFLHGRISAFAEAAPRYSERTKEIIALVSEKLKLSGGTREQEGAVEEEGEGPAAEEAEAPEEDNEWAKRVGAWAVTVSTSWAVKVSGSLFAFLTNFILVVIFLVFLLLGKPYFPYKMRKAFSEEEADRVGKVVGGISAQIGRYLAVQFTISLLTGVLVWLALEIIGVDFAVTWGALAFFLNFIPNIGSIIASVLPVVLALVQYYPNLWYAAITFGCLFLIQMGIGNVLSPKIMGDRLNLSPVVILFSLLFWGWLWGIVGALLSVPIAVAIKIVCENVEPLHTVAVMMSSGKAYRKEFG